MRRVLLSCSFSHYRLWIIDASRMRQTFQPSWWLFEASRLWSWDWPKPWWSMTCTTIVQMFAPVTCLTSVGRSSATRTVLEVFMMDRFWHFMCKKLCNHVLLLSLAILINSLWKCPITRSWTGRYENLLCTSVCSTSALKLKILRITGIWGRNTLQNCAEWLIDSKHEIRSTFATVGREE